MKKEYNDIRAYDCSALLWIWDHLVIIPWLSHLAHKTTSGLKADGLDNVDKHEGYLFLTNHRDICMDSAWLSLILRTRKNIRPYIGIGNNLFGRWWIEPFVRTNRCFVVKRGGTPKELLKHSQVMSAYIHDLISHHHSIWLAQREGRAKDGNDRTQASVLKMLTLGGEGFLDSVEKLNICPVSLSYQYDPCDYLKAKEMQLKRDQEGWKKSKEDDIENMQTGIEGWKGEVVFRFTRPLNRWLTLHRSELEPLSRNEQIERVAQQIDHQIHQAYEIWPRGQEFEDYLTQQVAKINIEGKDDTFLREKIQEMYDNQKKNHEASLICGDL